MREAISCSVLAFVSHNARRYANVKIKSTDRHSSTSPPLSLSRLLPSFRSSTSGKATSPSNTLTFSGKFVADNQPCRNVHALQLHRQEVEAVWESYWNNAATLILPCAPASLTYTSPTSKAAGNTHFHLVCITGQHQPLPH